MKHFDQTPTLARRGRRCSRVRGLCFCPNAFQFPRSHRSFSFLFNVGSRLENLEVRTYSEKKNIKQPIGWGISLSRCHRQPRNTRIVHSFHRAERLQQVTRAAARGMVRPLLRLSSWSVHRAAKERDRADDHLPLEVVGGAVAE